MHHRGILPKNCRVTPSPLRHVAPPTFHPDISHPEFFSADIPPGCLTAAIMPGQRSTLSGCFTAAIISGRRSTFSGWERRTIQLPRTDMSGSSGNAYLDSLPGQLGSSDTRDSPDPFPPTIKEITLTILTTKSPELSLTFNARYIRQDILKFSQVS